MIITIILNIVFVLISLYLFFLFIKSKELHNFPCYNMMIISLIILIDNAFRLFPSIDFNEIFQYIQASTLTFLDKLLLTTITFQAFILFLGIVKTKFYYEHEKCLFFITLIITIVICCIITALYILMGGITDYDKNKYYYCGSSKLKDFADPIFDSIFLVINVIFFTNLLVYFFKKKEEASKGDIEDLDYGKKFIKFLLIFIVNSITFVESYLIIFNIIPVEYFDIIYLSTCLIIDLVYNINEITIKETLKLFCNKIYEEKYRETSNNSLTDDD